MHVKLERTVLIPTLPLHHISEVQIIFANINLLNNSVIENFKRSKGDNKKLYLHMITSLTADRHRNTCTVAFIT